MRISNEDIGLAVLIVAIAFAALLLGLFSHWSLSKANSIVAVAQGFATVAAIGLAGLFAYQRLNVFRTFYPHLTISHEITHRLVGNSYTNISVTAVLRNGSNVKVDIQDAIFLIRQIAPLSDEFIEAYNADASLRGIEWPVLDEIGLSWERNELIVEPAESHRETLDFVVSNDIKSVQVYTYFYNPNYLQRETSEGWEAVTAYDLTRED